MSTTEDVTHGSAGIGVGRALNRAVRAARFAGRVLHANVARPRHPWKVNLALTYWCQYKCQTCNIWRRKPTDELTTGEIIEFIRQNPFVSWVDLTGGEIFLRRDIGDILDAVVSLWPHLVVLHFPTNGFLTDAIVSAAARLSRSAVPHVVITVSVDGDAALNDRIRGISGGFRRQVATFNLLRQVPRLHVVFGVTVSRLNAGRLEDTYAALRAECPGLSFNDLHLNLAQVSHHYYDNANDQSHLPRDAAVRELQFYRGRREPSLTAPAWLEERFLDHLDRFLDTGATPLPCHSLRSSCFIDPWGTVYPCITYDRVMGSLRDTGMQLSPIWNADSTRDTQQAIWQGDCPQCWTACDAYPSILGNLAQSVGMSPRLLGRS